MGIYDFINLQDDNNDNHYDPNIVVINGKEYNIANLSIDDLPKEFQKEIYEVAKGVLTFISPISDGSIITKEIINDVSNQIHNQWMERNASVEQMIPYNLLPNDEKEKNTIIVDETIKALEFHKFLFNELNKNNIDFKKGIFQEVEYRNNQPSLNDIFDVFISKLSSENLVALCDRIEILKEIFEDARINNRYIDNLKLIFEETHLKFTFNWKVIYRNIAIGKHEYIENYCQEPTNNNGWKNISFSAKNINNHRSTLFNIVNLSTAL